MRTLLGLPLGLATVFVAVVLAVSILSGLNGVIPERDGPPMLRTLVLLLLQNTLVLAWTALLRRDRRTYPHR